MSHGLEFWSTHLSAIDLAGVTTKAYAQEHGLSVSALYYWRGQLKQKALAREASGAMPQFMPVQVSGSTPSATFSRVAPCTLVLVPGVRLELAQLPSAEWLAALGRALQGVH